VKIVVLKGAFEMVRPNRKESKEDQNGRAQPEQKFGLLFGSSPFDCFIINVRRFGSD